VLTSSDQDPWLQPWETLIAGADNLLELGCGEGRDSRTLVDKCKFHVAADIRQQTLVDNTKKLPNSHFLHFDHHRPLPFRDNTFDVIVASLCLHYCSLRRARLICCELRRVCREDGIFIGRVNSDNDTHFGACPGADSRLYTVGHTLKRFYTEADVKAMLAENWQLQSLQEQGIRRYSQHKMVWEFVARA
jgi:ubiquinone/menaquinone biosynthesis C-methylase UbiE